MAVSVKRFTCTVLKHSTCTIEFNFYYTTAPILARTLSLHACMYMHACTNVQACIHVRVNVLHVHVRVSLEYVHVHVHVHVLQYMYMYMYTAVVVVRRTVGAYTYTAIHGVRPLLL